MTYDDFSGPQFDFLERLLMTQLVKSSLVVNDASRSTATIYAFLNKRPSIITLAHRDVLNDRPLDRLDNPHHHFVVPQ